MAGRLTVRHLELFSAVCSCGGVSAAARELGVSIITEEDILGMIGQSEA